MHQQIRMVIPGSSPPDFAKALQILADAGISVLAVGGGNVEHGGEVSVAVAHGNDQDRAVDLLKSYHPRVVDVHLCHLVPDEPGQLLACIQEGRQDSRWANKRVRDIAIGVERDDQGRVPVQIFFEGPR